MQRRPPPHAWAWLQRSRPVLQEAAERLTGRPPAPGFVDELRARFDDDPFTRDVLISTIADVAFGGRVPERRPAGASWDRGLIWWASALAGTTPAAFEGRGQGPAGQRPLFGNDPGQAPGATMDEHARAQAVARLAVRAPERAALAARLRDLLAQSDGDQVPASAVRDLLAELDG
jgi:hypothetical protein